MDPYETKISDVLASQDLLARHPGASQLGSDVYSSSANTTSEIIQRQRYTGQYVSAANTLTFGAQSSFFLQPGSVMNALAISGSVVLPRYTRAPDFWSLLAVDSVELIISGSSSVQSLKISGRSHLEMILATLDSTKLEAIRKANSFIDLNAAAATVNFSFPLHLFFSSADICALFPLDTSTLQSQIIINVRWKPAYQIFTGEGTNAVTLPVSFNTLYMRVFDQVQISNDFALANQLRMDSALVYSLPGTYLQTFSQVVNMSVLNVEQLVNLTSMPSGQLQAILVSVSEVAKEGTVGTQTLLQPFANFGSIRMLYNGIEIYRCDSVNELALANSVMTEKDNGVLLKWKGHNVVTTAIPVVEFDANPVIIIPFANEISRILRDRRHEHTKDYSGSSLQFYFTIAPNVHYVDDTVPVSSQLSLANGTGDYRLNFTFVNSAIYEISQRTVSMQM